MITTKPNITASQPKVKWNSSTKQSSSSELLLNNRTSNTPIPKLPVQRAGRLNKLGNEVSDKCDKFINGIGNKKQGVIANNTTPFARTNTCINTDNDSRTSTPCFYKTSQKNSAKSHLKNVIETKQTNANIIEENKLNDSHKVKNSILRPSSKPLDTRQPFKCYTTTTSTIPLYKPSRMKIIGNTSEAFKQILQSKSSTDKQLRQSLKSIRELILKRGIPSSTQKLRGNVWKALLGMYRVSSLEYITLIKRGESPLNDKISNDVFRTCATDKLFSEKVSRN
jgi:hypothetical protein